jgi:hypothetical protein
MRKPSRNRPSNTWGLLLLFVLIAIPVGVLAWVVIRAPSKPPTAFISPKKIVLQFGLSREALTRSSRFDVCDSTNAADFLECRKPAATSSATTSTTVPPARPSIVAAGLQSDLADTRQRQFPANQVTVTAVNVGRTGILVNITANPLEPTRVLDGYYTGNAIIDRDDGNEIPIVVEIGLRKRTGAVTGWVLFALVLGALGGALIKWLDDSFGPIAALRRRQRRVEHFLRLRQQEKNPPRLPVGVLRRLDDVRLAIRSFDTEGVADTLQRITSNQDALIRFDRGLEALEGEIATQRRLLESGIEATAVPGAIAMEAARVKELRSRVWPWEKADKVMEELDQAEQEFRTLTAAMRRALHDPKYMKMVEKLALERVSGGADDAMEQLLQTTVSAEVTSAAKDQSTVDIAPTPDTNRRIDVSDAEMQLQEYIPEKRRSLGLWLLDNAWWLTLIVIALFVVFVGYQTQFLDDPGFQGDLTDYIQLAAWALAIQVAGGTIIDTAGKLRTSRSST